jgi:hypothetical protein
MDQVRFIKHKGKDIVVVDVSQVANQDEGIAVLQKGEELIRTQPPGSVLLVTNVAIPRYDVHGVEAMKNFSAAITPHIKASCVVGISGVKSVIFRSITRLTGRNIHIFETMEQAADWLVAQ